ncbi:hypothetical protein [Magnetospirillum sp. SS-4]|uniref:hypothetical protein n=1 Tax=Magnetospirillum sp. SS-4 TaxID=2681465 RepID=UPI0020C3A31E|nr:hypothetical protein [Magnetospirillum sp. SS-4]
MPIKLGDQQVATAVWPYIPIEHNEARKTLANLLASGHPLPKDGIVRVVIAIQVVEAGAVGVQVIAAPSASQRDAFRAWAAQNAKHIPAGVRKKWCQGDTTG